MDEGDFDKKKSHNERHSGRKADKKASKKKHDQTLTDQQRNPKAFAFHSAVKAHRQFVRSQDIKSKKHHIPVVDRTPLEPPPVIVAVIGGPKVGKSTLLRCLIKNYTRQKLTSIQGPVTIVAGKKRRLTFIEVNNDVNSMIDIAKITDIALLIIDATFGIEMEVFEFLEICRQHGSPRIMGVLNHLDMLKDNKALNKRKKELKKRFQVELYPGAKLFYLSGIVHEEYLKIEVKNLGRFISVMKFRPLVWRTDHPYVLVDRWEDITNPETVRQNDKSDRDVVLYGYVRGVPFQHTQMVHVLGCGDFNLKDITFLPDPCPLPEQLKKRSLNSKERLLYAPMSGVGGVVYDKDAIYIDLGGSHHDKLDDQQNDNRRNNKETGILQPLLRLQQTADEKFAQSQIKLFSDSKLISNDDVNDIKYSDDDEEDYDDEEEEYDDEDEDDDDDNDNGEEEGDENTDMESDDDTNNNKEIKIKKTKMPKFEKVVDNEGIVRRRAIFDDTLEVGDSEEEEEEEEDEDEEEEELLSASDDEEISENMSSSPRKNKRKHSDDHSDSEDYDVEGDLKTLCKSSSGVKTGNDLGKLQNVKYANKGSSFIHKSNKDSGVLNKIENILSKFTTETKTIPKKSRKKVRISSQMDQSDDSGISDEEISKKEIKKSTKNKMLYKLDDDSDDSENDTIENGKINIPITKEDDDDDEQQSTDDSEDEDGVQGFRSQLFNQATETFYKNQSSVSYLRKYIYGDADPIKNDDDSDGDEVGGMFQRSVKKITQVSHKNTNTLNKRSAIDDPDTSRFNPLTQDWSKEQVRHLIRDCFVTGEWRAKENAQTLLQMDDEDEDLYGDVVDIESGVKLEAKNKSDDNKDDKDDTVLKDEPKDNKSERDISAKQKRLNKKKRLKEMFDADYDDKGSGDYYDGLKDEMNQQAELNKKEFDGMDDETRVQFEGFRPGMYVRMKFSKMSCEFVKNFDPGYPVIVGGLKDNEQNMCFVRARIKVHRWFPKILKNKDPLFISLGWRRIQSVVYYAKREDNFRMRSLKYARKYLHLEALFWGHTMPVNTGLVAFQTLNNTRDSNFRIAATGVVLEADHTCKLVKKLKLIGAPEKVHEKTAFVKGMFNSGLEVAKAIGAKIQTQSGIRGLIKKSNGDSGIFRATFEDKIKMSDVVIMKAWVPIDLIKFCSIVRTLLLPPQEKMLWQGMRTVAQIKRDGNIRNMVNPDSLYTEIKQRREYIPLPMKIPRKLQRALPYSDKPKIMPKIKRVQRVVVVKDPEEVKMDNFIKRAKMMMEDKQSKENEAKNIRQKKFQEKIMDSERMKQIREKRSKALACKFISKKSGKRKSLAE